MQWNPVFKKLFGREIPFYELIRNPRSLFDSVTRLDDIRELSQGALEEKLSSLQDSGINPGLGESRFSLQPHFEVEEIVENSAGIEGTCLCAGLDVQLTTFRVQIKFAYEVDYVYQIEDANSFVFQQAELSYIFKNNLLRDVSFDLTYFNGERAPSFEHENLLTAGLGFQF